MRAWIFNAGMVGKKGGGVGKGDKVFRPRKTALLDFFSTFEKSQLLLIFV